MHRKEHLKAIRAGDLTPRVVEVDVVYVPSHPGESWNQVVYYAWAPTWEGPARPDYAAAMADLRDYRTA